MFALFFLSKRKRRSLGNIEKREIDKNVLTDNKKLTHKDKGDNKEDIDKNYSAYIKEDIATDKKEGLNIND